LLDSAPSRGIIGARKIVHCNNSAPEEYLPAGVREMGSAAESPVHHAAEKVAGKVDKINIIVTPEQLTVNH
jgi:hypothetical protein